MPTSFTDLFKRSTDTDDDGLDEVSADLDLRERVERRAERVERMAVALERRSTNVTPIPASENFEGVIFPENDQRPFARCRATMAFEAKRMEGPFVLKTSAGTIRGRAGDYVVRFPSGQHLVLSEDDFHRTFTMK